jgi:hypothetical protein
MNDKSIPMIKTVGLDRAIIIVMNDKSIPMIKTVGLDRAIIIVMNDKSIPMIKTRSGQSHYNCDE